MDDKTYYAFPIPGHVLKRTEEARQASDEEPEKVNIDFNSGFAEIEYDTSVQNNTFVDNAIRLFAPPPQVIEYKPVDPIRQRFFDMRSLASNRPFARDDSELFFRQARFMEDFTDNYEGEARFNMYFPYYQHMGYEQLRTYFTWRTKVRSDNTPQTHVSYIFLYIYELLSNIGVDKSQALDKLLTLLKEYKDVYPELSKYIPIWVKEYIVYYDMPFEFADFVNEHDLYEYYPLLFMFDFDNAKILELWNTVSTYDIKTSKFYQDNDAKQFSDYFRAVLIALNDYFNTKTLNLRDLIIYKINNRVVWQPFKRALFYPITKHDDRKISLPGWETYSLKNSRWTKSHPIFYSNRDSVVGYLIKKTEACMRDVFKYKYKLKVNTKSFPHFYVDAKEFDDVISRAVSEHYNYVNRTVVSVDFENLERIRVEALSTQDKLIVPEEQGIENWKREIENEELRIESGELKAAAEEEEVMASDSELNELIQFDSNSQFNESYASEWDALKDVLDSIELRALELALIGDYDIKTFADEHGVMLEVLADGINEKSVDIIGDSIIDVNESLTIFEDYVGNVRGFFALN